ncbi:MAG: L-aspartate oxidase, partial [Halothiobacillaceae bacterium]
MASKHGNDVRCDFLVIGSGIAGLSFALKAAEHGDVVVVTKKERAESNTNYAQGGIASVFAPDDSFDIHLEDTLRGGAGLCHEDVVRMVVSEGPQRVRELVEWGAQFTVRQEGGKTVFDLAREGGHSRHRIVHARDHTGAEVERALIAAVKDHPGIQVLENHVAVDLLTEHHLGREAEAMAKRLHCWGAYVLDVAGKRVMPFVARATVLATGGCGQVYLHTTNPEIATGDGVAMAYRAGARIANMEFMQFHPTSLYRGPHATGRSFLISEAVRGFGGILRTSDGEDFMRRYHPMASLAPRDVVARAIDTEMKKRGEPCVYLDVTHLDPEAVKTRFPHIYETCLRHKIDMTKEWIPVVPAAHYSCGGVMTDMWARTNLTGLYACGEVACTGLHGANRLASNSLLEAVVFAHHAYEHAVQFAKEARQPLPDFPPWDDSGTFNSEEWVLIA